MESQRKSNLIIVIVTFVVLLAVAALLLDLHKASEREVMSRFHAHQATKVRQLAHEMEHYLRARSEGAQVLSRFASLQHRDLKKMAADIQEYFNSVKKDHVKAISVYDEKGTIIYSTTKDAIGRSDANSDFFQWARREENKGKQFVSSLFHFLIAAPIYQEARDSRSPKATDKFVGVLTVTIDLEEVIAAFLSQVSANATKDHVWIVDTSGTVLFQSEHPEMVMKSIRTWDETCMQCHVTFDHVEKILGEKEGTIEYALRERPKKLAAFAPLTFENLRWSLVFNVSLDEVSGFLDRQLARTFLLIGVIAALLVGASMLIYRNNRLKIRAQEEARRWREKRELEEKIRLSEERYRRLVEISPEPIAVHCEGKIVFVNPAAVRLFGARSPEELLGKPALEFVHPDDREMVRQRIAQMYETGRAVPVAEERFIRLDGSIIDVEVAAVPTIYEGKPAVQVVARDITERKQAEEALRQSEERFRMVALQTGQIIYDYDIPTGSIAWSGAIESVTGYSSEEFSAVNIDRWAEMIHPEDRQPALDLLNKAIASASEYKIDFRFQRKDGSYITVADRGGFMVDAGGKAYRMLATMSDITERKRAELERQTMFEIIQGVTITANLDELLKLIHGTLKKVIYAENYFIALYDYKTGLFSFPYFVDQFDKAPTPKKLEKSCTAYVFRTGRPMLITEEIFQQLVEQGEVELVGTPSPSWLGVPLRTPSETIGVQVVQHYRDGHAYSQRDVEFFASVGSQIALAIERKRAEEATRQSEEKYRSLFEESKDVIFISNPDGRLLDINPAGVELFGYASKEELLGVDIARDLYWDPGKRDESLRLMHQQGYIQDLELEMRRKDGRKLFVLETATVVRDNDGNPIAYRGFLKDITAKKILEEQLRQAQKMESLGTLVGGIAHDFNNILAIIMGHASLLERREIDPEKLLKRIEAIRKASERGANLVRQMLTFARKTDTRTESVRVNDIVRELVKLLEETFPKTITFSLELEQKLPSIQADPDQIHQALLNISLNASDAILLASPRGQKGGTISFKTKAVPGSAVRLIFPEAREESYVQISIADTGIGMDEKTKSRLFEPFFTTKERGKGTGLGLAVVYGIVKAHHGFIDVESEFGRGTTFHLYLPVPPRNIEVFKTPQEEAEEVEGGTETILVVEDEELLLDLVRNLLEDKGYRVMTASDGIEAVEVYRDHKDQIDLVLMDIGLPGLEGREVLTNLKEVNPNVLVILASGYIDPQMKSELLKAGAKHFVQKPYVPAEILKRIRDVIRGSKV